MRFPERVGRALLPESIERGVFGATTEQELVDLASCGIIVPVQRGGAGIRFAKELTVKDPRRANRFITYKNMGKSLLSEGSLKECANVARVARLAGVASGFSVKRKGPSRRRRR